MNHKLQFIIVSLLAIFTLSVNVFAENDLKEQMKKKQHRQENNLLNKIDQRELSRISEQIKERIGNRQYLKNPPTKEKYLGYSIERLKANKVILDRNPDKINGVIHRHPDNGTPFYIETVMLQQNRGKSTGQDISRIESAEVVFNLIEENYDMFKLEDPRKELKIDEVYEDKYGKIHIRMAQYFEDIPVWGHDMVFHYENDGQFYGINARYSPTPKELSGRRFQLTAENAIDIAMRDLGGASDFDELSRNLLNYDGPKATKYIWVGSESQRHHLVWHVQVRSNFRDNWYYFIEAKSGEILEKYNATNFDGPVVGSGIDLLGVNRTLDLYQAGSDYFMIDASRPIWHQSQSDVLNDPKGALFTLDVRGKDLSNHVELYHVSSSNNTWTDRTAVSAHYNVGQVFEYFYNVHGRRGIDDEDGTIVSIIHVTAGGQPMDNAYWNGAVMAYGDGGYAFEPLAGALDVAAHEMAHGVIERTVRLEYKFQSGALNESLADVFGVMVDRDDWMIGEDVTRTSYVASGYLRSMQDPNNGGHSLNDNGWQPKSMNEFVNMSIQQDNGGVHVNSGIPNHAVYLIGNALGKDKTEKIYYRVLDGRYLNLQSNFIDMRLAAIRAAKELYGAGSTEENAVAWAFDMVGIAGENGSTPPPDIPPVEGQEWIATVNAESSDNSLYIVKPVIESGADIVQLTQTQVFISSGKPLTVSEDGTVVLFVDNQNFIRVINSDGSDEQVFSTQGVWNSISLSPDASKLAATTIYQDSTIYIFDLLNPNNSKAVKLYSATTQHGVRAYVTLYADVLDWDLGNQFIIYDAFNRIPQTGNAAIEYWDVNVLDVVNDIILPVFPPQPEGINIGNPSFAESNSNFFVFDLIDFNQNLSEVWAVDLFSGQAGLIEANGPSIAYPKYAPNDLRLVFQRYENDLPALRQIPMTDNRIQAAGPSEDFVLGAQLPYWFAIGQRDIDVEDEHIDIPLTFKLDQNYPNPFNPETNIRFEIPASGKVNLSIYDISGRTIATLVNEIMPAGVHKVHWDGFDHGGNKLASGIYLFRVRLNNGDMSVTRKMTLLK